MLTRRGWIALGALAAAVALVHGWLIGRFNPVPPERPATAPTAVPVALVRVELPPEAPSAAAQAPVAEPARAGEPEASAPAAPRPASIPGPPVARPAAPAAPSTAALAKPAEPPPIEPRPGEGADASASGAAAAADDDAAPIASLQLAAAVLPAASPAAITSPPVYRTRVPPSTRLVYRLSRGLIAGTGELDWLQDAGGYQLKLEGKLPLIGTLITQTSRGRVDATGLAPERHTDRRIRRAEQAASFQRGAGRVSFSGGAAEQPLLPGLQDRLSVMVQLAAIAAAGPQPPAAGQTVRIAVVGARGDLALWVLKFEGVQAVTTPDGPISAWHYRREPESPHDTLAEYWLDPARGHLPVRVRLTDGSGEPMELLRQSP